MDYIGTVNKFGEITLGIAGLGGQTWVVDRKSVFPQSLGWQPISKCSLEFIDCGPLLRYTPECPERLIHCILRLHLKHPLAGGASFAPIDTQSLVLDLIEVFPRHKLHLVEWRPVKMIIQACQQEGNHPKVMKVVDLPVNETRTVKDFLDIIDTNGLNTCRLICINNFLFGSRDFV